MGLVDYAENLVLNAILGDDHASIFPSTVYVALYTAAPTEAGTGGTEVSTSGTAYGRVSVTNSSANWPAASGGSKSNGVSISFPVATASWGTVTHYALFDAITAGNMLIFGALTSSVSVPIGAQPFFNTGALELSAD